MRKYYVPLRGRFACHGPSNAGLDENLLAQLASFSPNRNALRSRMIGFHSEPSL